jgi:phosphatidylserine/phosphatidylglycerophosphate/cardiolipin synthase-like enzyme
VHEIVMNAEHLAGALRRALDECRGRLFIATADVKDVHLPAPAGRATSIVSMFRDLGRRGVRIQLLHGGVPSGPFLEELKAGVPPTLTMRRCPRMHAKVIIVDGVRMYLGSANLTGAGLGAKSSRRRNFEAGLWTDEVALIDDVLDMLMEVWDGGHCEDCGRRDHCPEPLEEPDL